MKRCFPPKHWLLRPWRSSRPWRVWLLLPLCAIAVVLFNLTPARSQNNETLQRQIEKQEEQLIQEYSLPSDPPKTPVYQPNPPVKAPVYPGEKEFPTDPPIYEPEPEPPPDAPVYRPQPVEPPPPEPEPAEGDTPAEVEAVAEAEEEEERIQEVAESIPPSEYVLEFNRAPAVGDRLRLQGTYAETRLGFTRPRHWKLNSAKVVLRFQHSPALLAIRSNLTVLVNGTSIGSVPLNRPPSEIGNVQFNIPLNRLRDYNEISVIAQQHRTTDCTQEEPGDATLWTEVLPDSHILFNYQPQPIALDFGRYPYPFFDPLSLENNRVAYLKPKSIDEGWLTAVARHSVALGRFADYRPLDIRLVETIDEVRPNERLAIVGTPKTQPALETLDLPLKIDREQVLDATGNPLPFDLGVLMLTTARDSSIPVLVVTGNESEGVLKAIAALLQPPDRQLLTGSAVFVNQLSTISTPPARLWPRYLPQVDKFQLKDLNGDNGQPFEDVTVRGVGAKPIEFNFKALPDDRFKRGSSMTLVYSYGPQINPRTSAVEVLIDGVFVGGARLSDRDGETRQTLKVDLPENLIQPNSRIQVAFRLSAREEGVCGSAPDQQLTGTLHADTRFNLKREVSVELPDLKLLQFGYPFAAPQDLSGTAMVLPDNPSKTAIRVLLEFGQRLGRLSRSESIELEAYTESTLPPEVSERRHLVAIGTQEVFPFPQVLNSKDFALKELFERSRGETTLQTLPDAQGIVREVISPFRGDRVFLALTAQREKGLRRVQQLFEFDPWFYQLQGDTVLVSTNTSNPSPYDPNTYQLAFLQQNQVRRFEKTGLLSKISRFFEQHWYVLLLAIIAIVLVLYGIVQVYLKRMVDLKESKENEELKIKNEEKE